MFQSEVLQKANWKDLLDSSGSKPVAYTNSKDLHQRLTGAFYTPEAVGRLLVRDLVQVLPESTQRTLRIVDPFAGDGRLLRWFIDAFNQTPRFAKWTLDVHVWDCSESAIHEARAMLLGLRVPGRIALNFVVCDTFSREFEPDGEFDLCLTNPPLRSPQARPQGTCIVSER